MTCEQAMELIGAYLDNDLPTETCRRVEKHLLGCRDCAYESESLRITRERLKADMDEVLASDAFRARVLAQLRLDNPHLTPAEPAAEDPLQFQLPIPM